MFSITPINLISIKLGLSVTGVGQIGRVSRELSSASISNLGVPWHDLPMNPSIFSLLSWHTKVSNFTGRDKEIGELECWAKTPQAVLVKFVIGDGGVGKSRLAAQFADALNKRNWSAGFIDLHKPRSFPLKKEGTLLIIDYPEENRDQVAELLRDLTMLPPIGRLRVLFLTRQQIDDWHEVIHDSNAADIVDMVPVDLGRLDNFSGYGLFCSALERVAEEFNTDPLPLAQEAFDVWIREAPENDRALFILAAAVHSAIHPGDMIVRYNGREVMETLVGREIDRLHRIAKSRGAKDPYVFARLLAMASIASELRDADVRHLVQKFDLKLGFQPDADIEKELSEAGLLTGDVLRAPEPDLVAAAFSVKVLSQNLKNASELVWASMQDDIKGGFERLGRLSYDAEIVLGIHEHRLGTWLANAVKGQQSRCKHLENVVSDTDLPVGLIEPAVAVWRTLLKNTKSEKEKARLLNNLSNRLSDSGDDAGALKASSEAVEIYRRLARANPARYEPDLALSLNNLSNCLSASRDNASALKVSSEAVEIRRRLAKANPARY